VENQDVYLTFSPNFERIWLEAKKRLPEYVSQKLANLGLRSQYSIRLYGWVKKLRQKALDTAIAEITKKTDISIAIESLARSKYRRVTSVTFSIEAQAVPKSASGAGS
jgi:plasmid replication initiation protein